MTPRAAGRGRAPVAEAIEARVLLSTFTVINTDDSGPGSLRQAMLDANANSGFDIVSFNIPGSGVHTIEPLTPLPDITGSVSIDGAFQPGAKGNSAPVGTNALVTIEIDGRMIASPVFDFSSTVSGASLIGLCINHGSVLLDHCTNVALGFDFLGTDPTGMSVPATTDTVVDVEGGTGNQIGISGSTRITNVIAGGSRYGVYVNGGSGNLVQEGLVGVAADGVTRLGNGTGVSIQNAQSSIVADSVIGGSAQAGISLTGGSRNRVGGNLIGISQDGHTPLPNRVGLSIQGEQDDPIGNTNVISGNAGAAGDTDPTAGAGIVIVSSIQVNVQSTNIGTDPTGTTAVANHGAGVVIDRASTVLLSDDLIGGNTGDGVDIGPIDSPAPPHPPFISIMNCNIGAKVVGVNVTPLGNGRDGVRVEDGATGVSIEGTSSEIAFNGANGVTIGNSPTDTTTRVSVIQGGIFSNHGLGIDLGDDGVTPNTPGGPHQGPNQLQNAPAVDWARIYTSSDYRVSGTIDSTPNTNFSIDVFDSPAAGTTGHVQGTFYRQTVSVSTDASGHARFVSQPIFLRPGGPYLITATATGPSGTSEFSAPLALTSPVADLNGDSTVGFSDLLILAQNYGQPGTPEQGDLNLDGTVAFADLLLLAQEYGQSASPAAVAAAVAPPAAPASSPAKRARLTALLTQLA